ncbi:MAG: bifunctional metallophosphatase/5-nucleotidase [Clostridiales bacterium]|jgi:2',3'-cyclic-nucleotide 2'-phosphodiesterase (5'-nucleotidase family)|nr:bifunctional metallophosphatase/5-nucleotidase [Clostridiales bacterium]
MLKNTKRKLLSLVLAVTMVISTLVPSFAAEVTTTSEPNTITILHTNDMHGGLVTSSTAIGADIVASVKKSIDNAILVDAGDAMQGSSFATLTQGADVVRLMNAAGYDVMVAGNHEFDYSQERLIENAKLANFPILSANTVKDGKRFLDGVTYSNGTKTNNGANYIIEKNGVKVGFFGITTPQTATSANPMGLIGIKFEDAIVTSKAQIAELKAANVDVIIGIMHVGIDESSPITSKAIATALEGSGLNVIIDGHSHSEVGEVVGGIQIAQTGTASANLGVINISVVDKKVTVEAKLMKAVDLIAAYVPNEEIAAMAAGIIDAQKPLLAPVVGKTSTALWGGTVNTIRETRIAETNIGNLIADSMVAEAKKATSTIYDGKYKNTPVIALQNGGGIRAVVKAGDVTVGDVLAVLPFGNILAYMVITPDVLYKAIENGVGSVTGQDSVTGELSGYGGQFPQISGFRFEYNPSLPKGEKVTAIYIGSSTVALSKTDSKTELILASNNFEIAGGDGYTMLKDLPSLGEGRILDVVLQEYVTELTKKGNGSFYVPMYEGRIKAVGVYEPKNYSASITVTDKNGIALDNFAIKYKVDNSEIAVTAITDINGTFKIANLTDGPHGIKVYAKEVVAQDVLVNNFSGAGMKVKVTAKLPLGVTFSDVDKHWAKDSIYYVASKGFVNGTGKGEYSPLANITRKEFVVILSSIAGIDKSLYTEKVFDDVDSKGWYGPSVAWATKVGITSGTGNSSFRPNDKITRAEMAAMIARFVEKQGYILTEVNTGVTFNDQTEIAEYALVAVSKMQKAGIINGTPGNFFKPEQTATRAECAQMLATLLKMQ